MGLQINDYSMTKKSTWENECPHCGGEISAENTRSKICEHCGAGFRSPPMRYALATVAILLAFILMTLLIKVHNSKRSNLDGATSNSMAEPDSRGQKNLDGIRDDSAWILD